MLRLALASLLLAACGDNLSPPPVISSCVELANATPRPDIGECLVDGTGFLVAGVSYRSADGSSTWVQAVQEHDGDIGVVTRYAYSTTCEWRPCQLERLVGKRWPVLHVLVREDRDGGLVLSCASKASPRAWWQSVGVPRPLAAVVAQMLIEAAK